MGQSDVMEQETGKKTGPLRCFEGTARPHEAFWRIRDAADGEAEVELYGWISEYSWLDDDITPKMFKDDLYRAGNGNGPVTIRMNSAGGDVIAASVMRSIIMDYPGKVTVRIDGLAASAATVVATAGDRVLMQDTGYFMIHDPLMVFMMAALNIEELKRIHDTLASVKDGIIGAYATKTGLSREKLSKLMTAETWMSADEAKKMGFIDEIVTSGGKKMSHNAGIVNALRNYGNVPVALMDPDPLMGDEDLVVTAEEGKTTADKLDATARRLRAECNILKRA
jgi:ATP-dependent Clp protease protease subunit